MLRRLNEELLEAELSETQFAAAVYALVNVRTRRVELARGGAPYPILRRADGRCELLCPAGLLVGVVPDASFAVESFELAPGESLVLYSDGLEQVARHASPDRNRPATLREHPHAGPEPRPVAPDEFLTSTDWYARLGSAGLPAALEQLSARHDTLRRLGQPLDDLTVLAINVDR